MGKVKEMRREETKKNETISRSKNIYRYSEAEFWLIETANIYTDICHHHIHAIFKHMYFHYTSNLHSPSPFISPLGIYLQQLILLFYLFAFAISFIYRRKNLSACTRQQSNIAAFDEENAKQKKLTTTEYGGRELNAFSFPAISFDGNNHTHTHIKVVRKR